VLAFLTGTVKDEAGQPLTGAVVALLEATFNGREVKSVRTDSDGKFAAALSPGSYRLRAAADGFKPVLARVLLDRAAKLNYDIALNETIPSSTNAAIAMTIAGSAAASRVTSCTSMKSKLRNNRPLSKIEPSISTVHSRMVQLLAVNSLAGTMGREAPDFYGTNFAISGSFSGNFEMAIIGQRGSGPLAAQRVEAIATMRPWASHQITASVGYGQTPFRKPISLDADGPMDDQVGAPVAMAPPFPANGAAVTPMNTLQSNPSISGPSISGQSISGRSIPGDRRAAQSRGRLTRSHSQPLANGRCSSLCW
jgi:hypothetical protein